MGDRMPIVNSRIILKYSSIIEQAAEFRFTLNPKSPNESRQLINLYTAKYLFRRCKREFTYLPVTTLIGTHLYNSIYFLLNLRTQHY